MTAHKTLNDAVVSIGTVLSANAKQSEALGQLAPESFTALKDAGLFRLWIPEEFGGIQASPVQSLETLERLVHQDGAAGWVVMATRVSTAMAGAFLPDEGAKEVFNRDSALVAGQGAPNGKAEPTDGGFILNGRWNYGSGSRHADHILSGAFVFENGQRRQLPNGAPEGRMFIVPRQEVTLEGNWDVMGLQATGSVDYSLNNVFVPTHRTFLTSTHKPMRGNSLHRLGLAGFTAIGHTAFALGTARHALDEIVKVYTARAERRAPGPAAQVDLGAFCLAYGDAEAKCQAARAFAYDTWKTIEEALDKGEPFSTRHLTLARLVLNYVTTVAVDNATFAYKVGGGLALRELTLQRCFREMYVGAQHMLTSPDVLRECGRELAGFAVGEVWQGPMLVPGRR